MTGTIKFDCDGSSINVQTKLEHVDMFDQAHLVMILLEALQLDVTKDMDKIARLLALASVMKAMNLTNGTKIDFSAAMKAMAENNSEDDD